MLLVMPTPISLLILKLSALTMKATVLQENIPNLQLTLAEDEDEEESLGLTAEELEH